MNCFLTQVTSLSPAEAEKTFISVDRHLLATASDDGTLRLYSFLGDDVSPTLSREFRDHHAPIVAASFSPLSHKSYLLSIGYDKSLNLYNLDEPKGPALAFSYTEESKEVGFFTCATFVPTEKSRLLFLVGTSTGALLAFDSKAHFEPRVVPLPGSVKAVSAGRAGEVLVAVAGRGVTLFSDASLTSFIELEQGPATNFKVSHLAFAPDLFGHKAKLFFTAGEEKLAIWEFDSEGGQVVLQRTLELGGGVAGVFWTLSGLSLFAFVLRRGQPEGMIEAVHVARNLDAPGVEWSLEPINLLS